MSSPSSTDKISMDKQDVKQCEKTLSVGATDGGISSRACEAGLFTSEKKTAIDNNPHNSRGLLTQELWSIPGVKGEFIIAADSVTTSSFRAFVLSKDWIPFLKSVLYFTEHTNGFKDYHFCIVPRQSFVRRPRSKKQRIKANPRMLNAAKKIGWYIFIVGDKRGRNVQVPDAFGSLGMDSPIEYKDKRGAKVKLKLTQRDICVEENLSSRGFMDAKGRSMYVIVMRDPVRRQSELSDDQLTVFWQTAINLLDKYHRMEDGSDVFQDMRINAGGFQAVAHLHLKIWMSGSTFNDVWGPSETYKLLRRSNVCRKLRCVKLGCCCC